MAVFSNTKTLCKDVSVFKHKDIMYRWQCFEAQRHYVQMAVFSNTKTLCTDVSVFKHRIHYVQMAVFSNTKTLCTDVSVFKHKDIMYRC